MYCREAGRRDLSWGHLHGRHPADPHLAWALGAGDLKLEERGPAAQPGSCELGPVPFWALRDLGQGTHPL